RYVGIASQVTEVLRDYEGPIVFSVDETAIVYRITLRVVVGQTIQHSTATAAREKIDKRLPLRSQISAGFIPERRQHRIYEPRSIQTSRIFRQESRSLHKCVRQIQLRLGKRSATSNSCPVRRKGGITGQLFFFIRKL